MSIRPRRLTQHQSGETVVTSPRCCLIVRPAHELTDWPNGDPRNAGNPVITPSSTPKRRNPLTITPLGGIAGMACVATTSDVSHRMHASLLRRRRSPIPRTPPHTVCLGFGSEGPWVQIRHPDEVKWVCARSASSFGRMSSLIKVTGDRKLLVTPWNAGCWRNSGMDVAGCAGLPSFEPAGSDQPDLRLWRARGSRLQWPSPRHLHSVGNRGRDCSARDRKCTRPW